ncbi:hypothetical protein RND81_08G069200 [Saponaria officinalis]|uniref:Endonuclease/exonuclease/phosphatase domain-containing protein n=1 Tax=Saponaria officinalis TaxID=3572 RepID=A0AAW1J588_SAPOF
MIISSWNVRGMNDPLKQQEVLDFLRNNKVDCGAIVEAHVKEYSCMGVFLKRFGAYSLNPITTHLTVLDRGAQFLHCMLLHRSSHRSILDTFVYAYNRATERLDLWDKFRGFSIGVAIPWVCLGDFNVTLSSDERVGSVVRDNEMQAFRDCLHFCGLTDHPYTGGVFTWHNKQEASPKWAKLDRLLVNQLWFFQMPMTTVAFIPFRISDHAPVLLSAALSVNCHRPFRYLNCWALSSNFVGCWFDLFTFSKLRRLRGVLKSIHCTKFSDLRARVAMARLRLNDCQLRLQASPTCQLLLTEEKQLLGYYCNSPDFNDFN